MRLKINFYKTIYKAFLSPKSNLSLIKHPDTATNLQEEHRSGEQIKECHRMQLAKPKLWRFYRANNMIFFKKNYKKIKRQRQLELDTDPRVRKRKT